MSAQPRQRRWRGPPLALQILALLVGGLVVAQLVTLLLTLLLPPAPAAQYGLDDIAAALRGGTPAASPPQSLQRLVQAGPPDISGPGWLVSEKSRHDLAGLLGTGEERVSLAFYTPLPFAGTAAAPAIALKADDGPIASLAAISGLEASPARLILAQAVIAGVPPGRPVGPAFQGADPAMRPPLRDVLPPGLLPGTVPPGAFLGHANGARDGTVWRGTERPLAPGSLFQIDPNPAKGGIYIPGDGGAAVPPLLRGGRDGRPEPMAGAASSARASGLATGSQGVAAQRGLDATRAEQQGSGTPGSPQQALGTQPFVQPGFAGSRIEQPGFGPHRVQQIAPMPPRIEAPPPAVIAAVPQAIDVPRAVEPPSPASRESRPVVRTPAIEQVPVLLAPAPTIPAATAAAPPLLPQEPVAGPPIAVAPVQRGLFGFAPAPFVEGDFVAALRLADGRWSVVQPAPEPFPNSWQRRVLLWFVIAFAIVAPLGWLFARRLVKPLGQFAAAAERLGRDPAASVIAIGGPAEIGRAANAFNLMQTRLRSFVDDRTAMIGAISHDLRTPLTRMRFRIEDVPDEAREGLLEEVAEMEAMITSVLEFIRDASAPGLRERLDLRALVDDVVEDAVMIGNDVRVEQAQPATVDIDVLGMRRVLDNLVENAVKYGRRARVRLTTDATSAVAEILDDGPGLPDEELERVFEPFYRSEAARSSNKSGHGLGLAVCRSIARAHGGDVRLLRSRDGFLAEVRLPLAFVA